MSGVLQVDPEDPADDLSQDLYEVWNGSPELGFSKVRRQHPLLMAPPWNESLAVFTLVLTQGLGAGNL